MCKLHRESPCTRGIRANQTESIYRIIKHVAHQASRAAASSIPITYVIFPFPSKICHHNKWRDYNPLESYIVEKATIPEVVPFGALKLVVGFFANQSQLIILFTLALPIEYQ